MKVLESPVVREAEFGLTATEVKVMAGFTVRTVARLAERPTVSLAETLTVKVPVAVGTQARDAVFDEVHPAGRPM